MNRTVPTSSPAVGPSHTPRDVVHERQSPSQRLSERTRPDLGRFCIPTPIMFIMLSHLEIRERGHRGCRQLHSSGSFCRTGATTAPRSSVGVTSDRTDQGGTGDQRRGFNGPRPDADLPGDSGRSWAFRRRGHPRRRGHERRRPEPGRWLASEGFLAAAPDLLHWGARDLPPIHLQGSQGETWARLRGRRSGAELADPPERLYGHRRGHRLLHGRRFALLLASRGHGFAASSVSYGQVPADAASVLEGACPVVGSFGARDRTLKGAATKLDQALAECGGPPRRQGIPRCSCTPS